MTELAAGATFADRVLSGERVRCGLVVGAGGFGKSHLAETLCEQLQASSVTTTLVPGDLAPDFVDLHESDVLIVDSADQSSEEFLKAVRREALSLSSDRSFLLLARNSTLSTELAELTALADRDGMIERLGPLSSEEIARRMPESADEHEIATLSLLTGGIPLHVDRLCSGWDASTWPADLRPRAELVLPDRFVDAVVLNVGRLSADDRVEFAARSVSSLAFVEVGARHRASPLIEAGLASSDGEVPYAVALAALGEMSLDERRVATRQVGLELLQTDPAAAATLLVDTAEHASWAAVALAAAGQVDRATSILDGIFGESGEADGAGLASSAHVAALQSRWPDAASFADEIESHPYWSDAKVDVVKQLYHSLDVTGSPTTIDTNPKTREPGVTFLAEAISVLEQTRDSSPDGSALVERLRSLVRQSSSQQPTLDIAVSASELAAIAALLVGEFEIARTLIDQSPESSSRTELNEALGHWISLRSGRATQVDDVVEEVDAPELLAPKILSLAAHVMSTRRTGDLSAQAGVLDSIIAMGSMLSVDVLTFDALCELHLGAQRLDARREAREIAAGLDDFVQRLGSPVLWEARLLWNRLESAIAAGDGSAVRTAAEALSELPDTTETVGRLVAAAEQWRLVFEGRIDQDPLEEVLDGLELHGFVWEAAALAGQAAIRTDNGDLARELLQRGRDYRQAAPQTKPTSPSTLR